MANPYDPPGTPGGPGFPPEEPDGRAVREAVNLPAILLIVTGALGVLLALINMASSGQPLPEEMFNDPNVAQYRGLIEGFQKSSRIIPFLSLVVSAVVIFGGVKMRQLQSWGLALTASVLAMIPLLGPCCCIGLPIGIWALVVLNKTEVKAAFR